MLYKECKCIIWCSLVSVITSSLKSDHNQTFGYINILILLRIKYDLGNIVLFNGGINKVRKVQRNFEENKINNGMVSILKKLFCTSRELKYQSHLNKCETLKIP